VDKQYKQNLMLDQFLNDVKKNTIFYKKHLNKSFNQLPVITKDFLSDNREEFLSDRFNKEDLVKVSTSGSYGTPMTFYRHKVKQFRQIAEVIFYGKNVNYYIGRNHAFIRGVSKSRLSLLLQNEVHIDPTKLDDESLEKMRRKIKGTKFIIGFPSVIISLMQYCEKMGDTSREFNMLGIITTAEPLTENQRKIISTFFNCNVVARYAMEELGIIANQCIHSENYHVNDASFVLEILKKENDNLADIGEEGRIVITDLYSNAMPLIRYDMILVILVFYKEHVHVVMMEKF
jgi:phenylacetate-CoA ligase